MRRLILSNISLSIAQNLGVDYHAAMEELYYYIRKKEIQTHEGLIQSIRSLLTKIGVEKLYRDICERKNNTRTRREKYELALNPIGSFIEQAMAEDSTELDKVIKDDLYRAYTRFCKEKRLAVESKENFGKILKKLFRFQDGREASGLRRTVWGERSQVNWSLQFGG